MRLKVVVAACSIVTLTLVAAWILMRPEVRYYTFVQLVITPKSIGATELRSEITALLPADHFSKSSLPDETWYFASKDVGFLWDRYSASAELSQVTLQIIEHKNNRAWIDLLTQFLAVLSKNASIDRASLHLSPREYYGTAPYFIEPLDPKMDIVEQTLRILKAQRR